MPAVSAVKVGIKCQLLRNTGTYGTPVWSNVTSALDVSVKPSWDKPEASTRGSLAKLYAKTMLDLSLEVKMRADDAAADYLAFVAALLSSTSILDCVVLNGTQTTLGVTGYRASWLVVEGPEDQAAGAVVYDTFTLVPGFDPAGYPQAASVGAGPALTFAALA